MTQFADAPHAGRDTGPISNGTETTKMAIAYNMHSSPAWRPVDGREVLERCRKNNGTITPYARSRGFRSFVVSWPSDGCEGHLYVLRVYPRVVTSERK